MELLAVSEQKLADKWKVRFSESWPRYRNWYLSQGVEARPTLEEARAAIGRHMPELVPLYDRVCTS